MMPKPKSLYESHLLRPTDRSFLLKVNNGSARMAYAGQGSEREPARGGSMRPTFCPYPNTSLVFSVSPIVWAPPASETGVVVEKSHCAWAGSEPQDSCNDPL